MEFLIKLFNNQSISFQLLLTCLMVFLGWLCNFSIGALIKRRYEDQRDPDLLSKLISTRNGIGYLVSILIIVLWAGEIKHGILSIAALVAAFILASKEMWTNFFGMVSRTIVRPFSVGDVIEVAGIRGRVVDMDAFTVKVLVYGTAGQVTGKIAEVPNSVLLTQPVINQSLSGDFAYHFSQLALASDNYNIPECSRLLERCAEEACRPFLAEAYKWFEMRAKELHIDLPSGRPYVLICPKDYRQVDLLLRFPCPNGQKLKIEQQILLAFYESLEDYRKKPEANPQAEALAAE